MQRVRMGYAGALGLDTSFLIEPAIQLDAYGGLSDYGITWNDPSRRYADGIAIDPSFWTSVLLETGSRGYGIGTTVNPFLNIVFVKGAGGYAGGAQYHNKSGGGNAILADWALDSYADRVPPDDAVWWWTGARQQTSALAHELGHVLGLAHPDLLNPTTGTNDFPYSFMGSWWDWPNWPTNPADPTWPLYGLHGWADNQGPSGSTPSYADQFLLQYRNRWFVTPVPEPSTLGLLTSAVLAIVLACVAAKRRLPWRILAAACCWLSLAGPAQAGLFITPLEGVPNQDWAIAYYVDLNSTSQISDYLGGTYSYNGHPGIDIVLPNLAAVDEGWDVYAAMDGKVIQSHDGEFDRDKPSANRNGNYVFIDHGGGLVTWYLHMRQNSVAVQVGDVVKQGQVIGQVGNSGLSDLAHLHFQVMQSGVPIETYLNPSFYWTDPLPYAGDVTGLLDADMTDHIPSFAEMYQRPQVIDTFYPSQSKTPTYWQFLHGLHDGDQILYRWYRPDGSPYKAQLYLPQDSSWKWWWSSITLPKNAAGTWRVEFYLNDDLFAEDSFLVVPEPATDVLLLIGLVAPLAVAVALRRNNRPAVAPARRCQAKGQIR